MIDESFITAAIKIRREYLKISSNMDVYQRKAKEIVSQLENLTKSIEDKQEMIQNGNLNNNESIEEIFKLLKMVEKENDNITESIDPLNSEMESLLQEEAELWRKIKEKHHSVPEKDIIEYVRKRLIEANLS